MKKFFLLMLTVFTFVLASAQTRTVTGQVIYETDGEPLIGATVVGVGEPGSHGTATDLDGNFSLKVSPSCKMLKVSYVGMRTVTVDIPASNKVDVKMVNSQTSLDEVMVVAYGTAKKSSFTGSATVIDASAIEQTQANNALNALTGKVSGVHQQQERRTGSIEPRYPYPWYLFDQRLQLTSRSARRHPLLRRCKLNQPRRYREHDNP